MVKTIAVVGLCLEHHRIAVATGNRRCPGWPSISTVPRSTKVFFAFAVTVYVFSSNTARTVHSTSSG